jgi:hypothetical protein
VLEMFIAITVSSDIPCTYKFFKILLTQSLTRRSFEFDPFLQLCVFVRMASRPTARAPSASRQWIANDISLSTDCC